ncbi:MAG: hypothetical protein A3C03_00435 [Candidatus Colwellbacteria bacterium RIFCSPHIGHO2_02_FULL_45_17]|uniref:Pilus assembly protein PilO n=2 Tax=Candidatus Colwelliibacteriota TaxID=1817904 RepID=A0A1G1ZEF7_9BACT|nr:MAG: hypothetical protein A3C03_00435 [Candidatus Colwellbacteria bacterium RIFCSPHIGHO2_02_FULL_45_17]OGY61094.1 MAG: hypothetical protein A3I33_01205 [Candidatus Colwellbacteria bacterium RIFCSPLOWO2_02_FULL_45_11]OGY62516.1 MAG: hypothetical protein A3G58_02725 [Candidatus Colwellbacteria bacterium RIFCSPLOWO2_12_FULL_46_17]
MFHKPKEGVTLQIAVAAGLSALIIILVVIVGVDTKNMAERVIETRTEINKRTKQSSEIARLREEAKSAEDKKAILEGTLPQKDELFAFPSEIAQIGLEKDVIPNFIFGSESGKQINYTLTVRGGYTNITEFVKALENNIPFMNISSFNLVLGENAYSINLGGNVFFNGEKE